MSRLQGARSLIIYCLVHIRHGLRQLPSEQHLLFRMQDLLREMLQKLDELHLNVFESQEAQKSEEVIQLLHDTRTEAGIRAMALLRAVYFVNNFAKTYLKFLVTVSPPTENPKGQTNVISSSYVRIKANITAKYCEKAQKDMALFGQDTANAVERATSSQSPLESGELYFKRHGPCVVDLITQTKIQ